MANGIYTPIDDGWYVDGTDDTLFPNKSPAHYIEKCKLRAICGIHLTSAIQRKKHRRCKNCLRMFERLKYYHEVKEVPV